MRGIMRHIVAVGVALLAAAPVAAQERQVARERFVFAGSRLTIDVSVEAPGTLRLIRGEPGSVRVASRSRDGFTSSGLAEDDRLTLSGIGDGPVDFLVAVPENVWVSVRLPGGGLGENVARGRSGTWEWEASEKPREDPVPRWLPPLDEDPDELLYTTFSRDLAPTEVVVPDLSTVARVSVRLQGFRFKVSTSRPLAVDEGNDRQLVIKPAEPPMDLVLGVPASTPAFTLNLGGATALIIDGTTITTLCTPVTDQQLSHGRRWFTFNPLDGALSCSSDPIQRHGG